MPDRRGYIANQTRKVTDCSVEDCYRPVKAAGMCGMHYQRWNRHGDVHYERILRRPAGQSMEWLKEQLVSRNRGEGCWVWPFSLLLSGHGQIWFEGTTHSAHLVSLLLDSGTRPEPPNHNALHSCDNPPCVNPSHLRWGSHADNAQDRTERGRQPRGEAHPQAKLTETQALAILSDPRMPSAIAADFGITAANVRYIKRGDAWKHLKGVQNA